MNNIISIVSRH